jgi:hypothetical protein
MEFRIACIAGVSYTEVLDKSHSDVGPGRHAVSSALRTLLSDPFSDSGNMAREFMASLAVCHTVIPEVKDGKMVYQASNPDEEALVVGTEILIHFGAPKLYVLHVLSEASSQFVERHVTKEVLPASLQVLAMRLQSYGTSVPARPSGLSPDTSLISTLLGECNAYMSVIFINHTQAASSPTATPSRQGQTMLPTASATSAPTAN